MNGLYPWSFVTQIFRSDYPGHGGNRKKKFRSADFNLTSSFPDSSNPLSMKSQYTDITRIYAGNIVTITTLGGDN